MWGLILKDVYTNKKTLMLSTLGTLFFSIPFFIPLGIEEIDTENNKALSMMYVMLYLFMFMVWADILLATISNDEKPTWINYVVSSPVALKGQVQSKYCEGIIVSMLCFSWCYMITQVGVALNDLEFSYINIAVQLAFILLLIYAIEIPFAFRYGSKQGNNIKFAFGIIIEIVILIYALYAEDFENSLNKLWSMIIMGELNDIETLLISLFPYVVGILYYISYRISCKLYLKGAEHFE